MYADVWRVGVTVADIIDFLDHSRADSSMHLTKPALLSDVIRLLYGSAKH